MLLVDASGVLEGEAEAVLGPLFKLACAKDLEEHVHVLHYALDQVVIVVIECYTRDVIDEFQKLRSACISSQA